MFSIVAQSILQFNQKGCQDDNLFNQIDIGRRLCPTEGRKERSVGQKNLLLGKKISPAFS
jgi:hypothetical protein